MDGINGITGGYFLVILLVLAYVNAEIMPFVEQKFIYIVIIPVLVFSISEGRQNVLPGMWVL